MRSISPRRLFSNWRSDFPPQVKKHSAITIVTLWLICSPMAFSGSIFGVIWAVMTVSFIVWASYEWYLFLRARREGFITDRNLFYQESAGPLRKAVFMASLIAYFLVTHVVKFGDYDLRYAVSISVYFQQFGANFLKQLIFWPMFLEGLRMLTGASWSNTKHIALALGMPLVISTLQTVLLYALWGHAALWF